MITYTDKTSSLAVGWFTPSCFVFEKFYEEIFQSISLKLILIKEYRADEMFITMKEIIAHENCIWS